MISFDWARSTDEPSVVSLIEVFRDAAGGAALTDTDHFRGAIGILPSLLAAPPKIIDVEAAGDGWVPVAELEDN